MTTILQYPNKHFHPNLTDATSLLQKPNTTPLSLDRMTSTLKRRIGMKGNEKIIEHLNLRLAEELTVVVQYIVHSEMCGNWGYDRLHQMIEKRAKSEMKHAEKLIARILFLDGRPIVNDLNKVHIGAEVPKMHSND